MSLFSRRMFGIAGAHELIPPRPQVGRGRAVVTPETALRHSAVWAAIRLRANLISTLPIDVLRNFEGRAVEVPKPPVLVNPGGERVDALEWLYSSQSDLDKCGNCFGVITERDSRGLPSRIDLANVADVVVRVRDGELQKYKIGRLEYDPGDIWHERQYTVSGMHVGLSPVAYAAWSIGEYLSVQDFATSWFGGDAIPAAHLKNTSKTLNTAEANTVKERFKASVQDGGLFVTGNEWDYEMIGAQAADATWIEAKQFGITDIARFFDVPSDLIEGAVSGSSVTYANITQRNLQLLIMHLGPAIIRRENNLAKLLPRPRYVKFNSDALLRMDPKSRQEIITARILARTLAPSEARALDDQAPFTEEQLAEFDRLFGKPNSTPQTAKTGVTNG